MGGWTWPGITDRSVLIRRGASSNNRHAICLRFVHTPSRREPLVLVRRQVEAHGRYPTRKFGSIGESLAVIRVARMKCGCAFEFGGFLVRKRMKPVPVTLTPLVRLAVIALFLQSAALFAAGQSPTQSLDFEYYKKRVEPIFLKKRPGHARCVVCHVGSNNAFRLQPLPAGSISWTEEQSRRNFEIVSRLVTPGDATASRLLLHPLSPNGGGDAFHSGGRQFASQSDPDWRVLADWVRKATVNPSTTP